MNKVKLFTSDVLLHVIEYLKAQPSSYWTTGSLSAIRPGGGISRCGYGHIHQMQHEKDLSDRYTHPLVTLDPPYSYLASMVDNLCVALYQLTIPRVNDAAFGIYSQWDPKDRVLKLLHDVYVKLVAWERSNGVKVEVKQLIEAVEHEFVGSDN